MEGLFIPISNESEKMEKAVWLAANISQFPIEVFFPLSAGLRNNHFMIQMSKRIKLTIGREVLCDSRHLMAASATLFDFWITSETVFSAQNLLLAGGPNQRLDTGRASRADQIR